MKLTDKLALTEAHFDLHEVRMSYCLVASLRPFNLQTFPKKGCCNSSTYSVLESYSCIQSIYSYSSCYLLKDSTYGNLSYSNLISLRWTRQMIGILCRSSDGCHQPLLIVHSVQPISWTMDYRRV